MKSCKLFEYPCKNVLLEYEEKRLAYRPLMSLPMPSLSFSKLQRYTELAVKIRSRTVEKWAIPDHGMLVTEGVTGYPVVDRAWSVDVATRWHSGGMSFTHIDPQPAKDKKVVEERVFCDWRDTPSILQCLNVSIERRKIWHKECRSCCGTCWPCKGMISLPESKQSVIFCQFTHCAIAE